MAMYVTVLAHKQTKDAVTYDNESAFDGVTGFHFILFFLNGLDAKK